MGKRIHANNILWVCCCCGFLPFIGLFKGLIAFIPCTLIHVIPCTLIAIILLPHDIFFTYYSILSSEKIGKNVTALGMILLPIPLLLWPECVSIAYLAYGGGFGLFKPIMATFNEEYELFCGGIFESIYESFKNVKEFWNFNYNSYFSYLQDFRVYKLSHGEKPFDISLIELFIGIVIGTSGAIIDGILFTLLTLIKLIPGLLKSYWNLWKWFGDYLKDCRKSCLGFVWFGLEFPIFILANIVLPVGVVLVAAFICLSGFFIGVSGGYVAYDQGIAKAYAKMIEWAREYDEKSNKFIYGEEWSCL